MMHLVARTVEIQQSWLKAPQTLLVRYEDLIADPHSVFDGIMDYCRLKVSPQTLRKIVERNDFEKITGRKPGQEDLRAQLRKGVAGDWRNHFSVTVKDVFKQQFGNALVNAGYEDDFEW